MCGTMRRNGIYDATEESKISRNGRNHTHFHYSLAHLYWSCMISIPFVCSQSSLSSSSVVIVVVRCCHRHFLTPSPFSYILTIVHTRMSCEHEHVWITMCSIFSQILGHCYLESALNIIFICSLLEWIGCLTASCRVCYVFLSLCVSALVVWHIVLSSNFGIYCVHVQIFFFFAFILTGPESNWIEFFNAWLMCA